MSTKPALSFRVEQELKNRLIELATADRRTLAQYITLVLAAHVEAAQQPAKPRPAPARKR